MTSRARSIANVFSPAVAADVADATGGGVESYADVNSLPVSPAQGDLALISTTNKLYVYNGSAWFNIAIVNQAPTAITGNQASYALAIDGTPTVVTLVSTDPEGFPLTWSATTSGDTQVGTLAQADNVFTITPSTDQADEGALSVTFSVTDGNNTETSVSSFTLAFLSPYWDETVLSIGTSSTNSLDNSTFIDRSTNAHTVTTSGTPVQTSFHPYLDNWSVEFNGSDQGVYLGTTALDNLSSTFSMEAWIYPRSISTGSSDYWNNAIIAKGNTYLNFGISNNGRVQLYHYSGQLEYRYSTGTVNINEWTHVGVTVTGGTITFYINGVISGTGTWIGMEGHVGTDCYVGTSPDGNANPHRWFDGWIAAARVVDGSVVVPDPSTKATVVTNTLFLVNTSNRLQDLSGNYTPTPYGNPKVSAFNPFGQESEYAVGENKGSVLANSGYMSTSISAIGTGDFTLECWVYFTNTPGAGGDIIFDSRPDGVSTTGFAFYRRDTGHFTIYHGTGYEGSIDLNANQWYHLAVSRSSGTLKTFVNGVEDTSQSITSNMSRTSATVLSQYNGSNKMVGYVSDLNLTNGTGKYTTNFTPPTAPVGNTNASLYLPMDNAGIFDKTGNNALTTAGNASTSTTQTKFADTAMYFGGSGDYVSIEYSDTLSLGTGDFTIEGWVYPTAVSDNECIISHSPGSSTSGSYQLRFQSGKLTFNWSASSNLQGSTVTTANQWYYVAVTRENSVLKIWLNGSLENTNTNMSHDFNLTDDIRLGVNRNVSSYFNGYIENFQVLKGVAKYTANFTVPNRTQGLTYQAES